MMISGTVRRLAQTAALAVILASCADRPAERNPVEQAPATPADLLAARGAGEAFLQQDRLEEAGNEFRRLVELAPDDPAGYTGLGLIALREGRLPDAEDRLKEARQRSPDDPDLVVALARLHWAAGGKATARALLDTALVLDPEHARTLWSLAALESEVGAPGSPSRVDWLERAVAVAPGNLAAQVELVSAYLASGDGDAALAALETMRGLAPDVSRSEDQLLRETEEAARTGNTEVAFDRFSRFRRTFEVTGAYQADVRDLEPPRGTMVGIPQLAFSSSDNLRVQEEEAVLAALRYADATELSGFRALIQARSPRNAASGMAIGDFDGDGDEDVVWLDAGVGRFLRLDLGQFVDATTEAGAFDVADGDALLLADFDDDRRLDVYLGGSTPTFRRQREDGRFEGVQTDIADDGSGPAHRAIAADLDQDGDLDVFEARSGPNRLLRNNGDWTFTEFGRPAGVAGSGDTRDVSFGDLDDDGDLDLVLAEGPAGITVLSNLRGSRFEDVTEAVGLDGVTATSAVAIADVDNDGRLDILAAGEDGLREFVGVAPDPGDPPGSHSFKAGPVVSLGGLVPRDLETLDFDNDGWIDVGAAGDGEGDAGFLLLRNTRRGGFESGERFLPELPHAVKRVRATDYNLDGDSDLVLLEEDGGLRLLRNDGANANHSIGFDLMGLGEGSRKNNRYGIGARIEVRVGNLLQTRTVRDPSMRVGLGSHLKADVIRVRWPNGVAQDMYFPGTDQDLIERQSLKGSCPLLYLWNGKRFEFVGDVMWKSALGMPMGILGGGGERAYAPGFPSQEYRRLPDGAFRPRDGEYTLKLTEELWETIYVDEVDLVAVDHPDSIDVYVNERFVPPAPTELELWRVGTRYRPVSATDGQGRDHLAALASHDFNYVSTLRPGRFQGIAEPHDLVLDLGDPARHGDVVLYLTGWIFPTDASINVALRQSDALTAEFPVLEVIGPDGEWQTAISDLGVPSGKDKTVIADLRGLFPTADRRVRIRTNLMVYWDEAFFTVDEPTIDLGDAASGALRVTTLDPAHADLRFRGFSREYRKGGRTGPHWFDYDSVTMAPRWQDLQGTYTRYGDVDELLQAGDDMYVVANAGDEITARFDARSLPTLPTGWSRTLFIYTDGWVKDGDLNTATGDRVDPLPFRAQTRYPYGDDERFPDDDVHRRFLETFQTREVRRQ